MKKVSRTLWFGVGALLALALAMPGDTWAQCSHGASISKSCISPKPSCASDADCPDTQCSDGNCTSPGGAFVDCTISLTHADTCGDTTKITEGFDIDDFGGDNVRTPAVGNLPISNVFGNAICCPGPVLPCFVGPAGSVAVFPSGSCGNLALPGAALPGRVSFRNTQYNIQPNDPDPLPNQGQVKVQDQCDQGLGGCSTGISTVQFTAATDLIGGCVNVPKPLSTPCENDGNLCTNDHCNGTGQCVLLNNVMCQAPVPPCEGGSVCNPQTGMCVPQPDAPLSTPCQADGTLCTNDHCNGTGQCVFLNNVVCPGPNPPCEGGSTCNPGTGACDPLPDAPFSTPCDADASVCTIDHCDGNGSCVFLGPNPDPTCGGDHFKCYKLAPEQFTQRTVSLEDQFGPSTATVLRPTRFCNPASKNNSPVSDLTAHLACYQIREGAFTRRTVVVRNQFGDQTLTIIKPETLCNPAEKNGVPSDLDINHYKCYRARGKGFTTRTVMVSDQFETRTDTVLKPRLVCNPVEKNGSPIPNPVAHLTCYLLKPGTAFTPVDVDFEDQFGGSGGNAISATCRKRALLCLPSLKNPASPSGAFVDDGGTDPLG